MTASTPIRVYIGDDWIVPVNIVDTAGNAIDLTGAEVGANFWPAFSAAPVDLVAAGGGITVLQAIAGRVALTVPRSVTAVVPEQSVLQKAFLTRAQIFLDDTMGRRQTALLVAFQPVAARSTDLPSAMSVIGALTAVLSPQGPAGPSGELPPASEADAVAGLRDDVVITPATLRAAMAGFQAQVEALVAAALAGAGTVTTPQTPAGGGTPSSAIPQLIIGSTDPGQDVDDASHLALAIVAHKRGEVNLLAVAVCPQNDRAGGVARLMLDYAGLYGIPVATRKAGDVGQDDHMNAPLTTDYGYVAGRSTYPDPVPVMRAALAAAPDGSVVFSCVGPLPDMQDLLQSPADGIDPRTGMALVTAKCRDIGMVCQGGQYNPGQATTTTTDDFNWNFRPDSADYILRNFPKKIVLASASLTGPILIGPLLAPLNGDTSAQISKPVANGSGNYTVDLSNPLRAAHQEYQNLQYGSITVDTADPKRIKRSAFDPCALSYVLGLGGAWTLVQGNEVMDLTAPTQGTATFTVGAGTHYNMVPATDNATIAARLDAYLDAYDLGLTMPVAPTNVVLSEAAQGVVTVACDKQFGTTLVYSADGGAYAPVPASGITGLAAGQLHLLMFKAVRYSNSALTGPASAAVTITTKAPPAFVDPSSIGLVGMWTDGTATAAPAGGNVRLTALANKISGKPGFTTDYGPAVVPSTIFPSSLPTIQFQDGDAGSGPGTYGRMHTDVSAYAGATTYSVAAVVSSQKARNSNGGRIMVLAPADANDYDSDGAWWVQTDTAGADFKLVSKAADGTYPSVSATVGQNTPADVRVDVAVPNGAATPRATLIVNGVAIGSVPLAAGIPANAAIGFARQINQDSDSWFGEIATATAAFGARTAQQDDQLAGYRSWYAVKNGSLLPSSSSYKAMSP